MPKAPPKRKSKSARSNPTAAAKAKDPKASHLYTDDNPSTTIHGTGFKDAAAATRTLELIEKRSLIYQWQTVNTMYNRAKHHPSMKKGAAADTTGMKEAMEIFREWLDVTYPAAKAALRADGFKPLLSKAIVEAYLERIDASETVDEEAKRFAGVYVKLRQGRKLGNVLVDDSKPEEPDWDAVRYEHLSELVPAGHEDAKGWDYEELWRKGGDGKKSVTEKHLQLIAWAWSPVHWRELNG